MTPLPRCRRKPTPFLHDPSQSCTIYLVETRLLCGNASGPAPSCAKETCENKRTMRIGEIEQRVLTALKRHLLTPDAVAAAVEAYRAERQRLSRARARDRSALEREIAEAGRQIDRMIASIKDGVDPKLLVADLNNAQAKREALERQLRLAQACAEPNTLVIAPQTYEIVLALFEYRDLGRRSLKGFAEPVHLYQVLGPSRITNRFEARHPSVASVLLGREKELDFLIRRWERAKRGEGCAVLIAGEPGIGSRRLLGAVQAHIASEPHATLQLCSPYHQDSALHPVVAQLTRACGIDPGDPPERRFKKLAGLVRRSSRNAPEELPLFAALLSIPRGVHYTLPPDLTAQRRKERTMAALLDHVKQLAEHQPLLIVVEDLHWADPTSLELPSSVVDVVQHQRAMVLTTARPEFAAVWPSFEHASTQRSPAWAGARARRSYTLERNG